MKRALWLVCRLGFALIVAFALLSAFVLHTGADEETDVSDNVCDISVEQAIIQGFYSFSDSIDISSYEIKPEELSTLFSSVIKDDPYLFFVEGQLSYSYQPGGYVLSLKPRYSMKGTEVFRAWDECRTYIRDVAVSAMEWEEDSARALFLHDYICANFSYDESLENDNMYLFIKSGKGTCQAYTDLYNALLRECGIESRFVASDTIAHIWNYVKIDGEWYHADLTWDDGGEGILRRHFLLSDSMAAERGHKDWYSSHDVICESEEYANRDFDMLLHGKYQLGDADHDGEVGLSDVLLLRMAEKDKTVCVLCADMSLDGAVDSNDVNLVRQIVLQGSE